MSTEEKKHSKEYSSARDSFDAMSAEEKLCFLAESSAKAVVDGVQEVLQTFGEAFEKGWPADQEGDADQDDSGAHASESGDNKSGPAKKSTKRPSAKSSTTKKRSTKKSASSSSAKKKGDE